MNSVRDKIGKLAKSYRLKAGILKGNFNYI